MADRVGELLARGTKRDTGFEQGKAVLADLASHPATALHIATKLARHFVADEPPATLVETLRQLQWRPGRRGPDNPR